MFCVIAPAVVLYGSRRRRRGSGPTWWPRRPGGYAPRGSATTRSCEYGHKTWTWDYQGRYHHHGPWRDRLFHDRPTCARSRSIIFRPERGQPKVPFSWCRCHILDFHYRWGSMGPNETAITIPGGPRVIGVFDVHGCCRAQIKHFFVM